MKKILLINNAQEINEINKLKTNFFDNILVFDYQVAIACNQKKIKFLYVNDINKKLGKHHNLPALLKDSFKIAKKIDKKIHFFSKDFKNINFFTNYQKFPLCNLFLEKYYYNLNFIIKKFPKAKFFYYYKKIDNFDFLIECIEVLKLKYKKKFFKISNLETSAKNLNYPNLYDDINPSFFKNFYKNISNFQSNEKNFYLIYLLEKEYRKKIELFAKNKKINLINYNRSLFKKTYFQQNSFKEKFKFDIFKDRIKNIYFKKLIIFLSDYIINDVLETKNNISKFLQKKNINFFCTSHNTLISNTIRETLNKKNIKSFTLLHGGTVGHFNHGFFWPDLAHQNLKNKKISFNQTYSNNHSKELKKNNHSYKLNKKSEYISFKSETFFNLKNLKKRRKSSFNIGYITQSNSNILFNLNRGNNDPLNLYKFRTNLLNEILKRYKKFKLLVSLTETSDDLFCEQNILEKAKKMNMIKIYNWNAIEILKKADLLILEQPSTTLIESLFLDVSKIIIINNPLWDFNYSQKKILSNRVSFANTYDDIISFILKKNKKKTNNLFLKKYYQPKKNKEINYFLNKMLI